MFDNIHFEMGFLKIILISFIAFLLYGCNRSFNSKAQAGEGTITYSISYPDSVKYGLKAALMPKTTILFFKGGKSTFVTSAGLGTVQIVDLLDADNKTFISLFIDELHGNVGCKRTPEEIASNENNPRYTFHPVNETKIIENLECKKVLVKNINQNTTSEIYYYDKIKFNYMNSPFASQPNLMLEYSHTINNLNMKLKAIKVDLETPVDSSMFIVKGNYRWLNEKDYYEYLNSLK